ncbi:hypothetical protein PFISCL1PPCAC_15982, partial [Pristionchus fissidentatus]
MTTFRHLVLGATVSSGVAIIGSLLVAFSLVSEINTFRDDIMSDLSHFKTMADDAWEKMVISAPPASTRRDDTFSRFARQVRVPCSGIGFAGSWYQWIRSGLQHWRSGGCRRRRRWISVQLCCPRWKLPCWSPRSPRSTRRQRTGRPSWFSWSGWYVWHGYDGYADDWWCLHQVPAWTSRPRRSSGSRWRPRKRRSSRSTRLGRWSRCPRTPWTRRRRWSRRSPWRTRSPRTRRCPRNSHDVSTRTRWTSWPRWRPRTRWKPRIWIWTRPCWTRRSSWTRRKPRRTRTTRCRWCRWKRRRARRRRSILPLPSPHWRDRSGCRWRRSCCRVVCRAWRATRRGLRV